MLKNVTIDETANILVDNQPVLAKDFICKNQIVLITGLEAIKAMIKNGVAKAIVTVIADALEGIINNHCKV